MLFFVTIHFGRIQRETIRIRMCNLQLISYLLRIWDKVLASGRFDSVNYIWFNCVRIYSIGIIVIVNNSNIFPWTVSFFQEQSDLNFSFDPFVANNNEKRTLVFIFNHFASHWNTKRFFNIQTKSWYPECGWGGHICISILSLERINTCVTPENKISVKKAHKWSRHKVSV